MKITASFALIWVFAALINLNTISNTHAAYIPSPSSKGSNSARSSAYVYARVYVHANAYVSTQACVHASAYVSTRAWSPPVPMYPPETMS